MANRYIIVGDLHGHYTFAEKSLTLATEREAQVVFVGDLTDSFSQSENNQYTTIKVVTEACATKNALCMWGNHDLSYINPTHHRCSGFTKKKKARFSSAYQELIDTKNFVSHVFIRDNILVTHAGLAPEFIPTGKTAQDVLTNLSATAYLGPHLHPLLAPGIDSGGGQINIYGGITWLRMSEISHGIENLLQIVGHTPVNTIRFNSRVNFWCIDSLEYGFKEVLYIDENDKIETISLV
jgi:hypothetical protein